jgi:hypothetical protein
MHSVADIVNRTTLGAVMTDPYRIAAASEDRPASRGGMLRPVLWLVLIVSAAANATASMTGVHPLVGIGSGVITLACAAALVVHHYRHRTR